MDFIAPLLLFLTPLYAWRFNLLGAPLNMLTVGVFFCWLFFLIYLINKKLFVDFYKFVTSQNSYKLVLITIFFLSGSAALFINGVTLQKIGQFTVLFLQPVGTFFIVKYIFNKHTNSKTIFIYSLYVILAIAGLFSILQYFFFAGLPQIYWGNSVEPKRAVAFFSHPNFYALWSTPLLAFLIPDLAEKLQTKSYKLKATLWALGCIGLLLSLSRAGWLGLAAALTAYLVFAASNKFRKASLVIVIVTVIIVSLTPNLRYRFLLPFYGEKSAVSRFSLWDTGVKAVKESPVLGLGLTGFGQNWNQLNTDPNLDTHNFPHNIFLNFWIEIGLMGLLSFIGLVGLVIYNGFKNRHDVFKFGAALFILALLTQGQLDNPYFKNDLAIIFWIIMALI